MRSFRTAISLVLLVSTMTFGLPSVSNAASDQLSVSSLPPEFVIGEPNAKQEKLTLEVFVTSQAPQRLVVEFIDFFSGQDGATTQLPSGSTPYSLANVLEIQPFDGLHNGGGKQQRFEIEIIPKKQYAQSLFNGGVVVRLEPIEDTGKGIGAAGSILRALTVTPFGLAASLAEGELLPAQIVRHDLTRLSRSSFIDSVLPDIPGVVNFGAVESTVTYKNVGEYPVFAGLDWKFKNGETVIASKAFRPALLSPGQTATKEVTTEIAGQSEGSRLNLLPTFGFVSNSISVSSSLGGTELPVQKYDGSFFVLQWKEPLVATLGLYLLLRWAWRRNLSPKQRHESTSLVSLAIKSLIKKFRPKPVTPAGQTNLPVAVQGYSSIYPASSRQLPYRPNPIQPRGPVEENRYPKPPESRF